MSLDATATPSVDAQIEAPASIQTGRNLKAEQTAELARDTSVAKAKTNKYEVRAPTSSMVPIKSAPEYATLVFKTAVNNPMYRIIHPAVSTYVPNSAPAFMILSYMDGLMSQTDKWTRSSGGWVPPISQMYIGVLTYLQIIRCMISARIADNAMISWYTAFSTFMSPANLWIPGPLVSYFRSISAFQPDESGRFGTVSPILPVLPGWSRTNRYGLGANHSMHLPNIAYFVARYHQLCQLAVTTDMNESNFFASTNGPNRCSDLFNTEAASSPTSFLAPGMKFTTPGSLDLWKKARSSGTYQAIPTTFDVAHDNVPDQWDAVMLLTGNANWFPVISGIMNRYCQYFNGSDTLENCSPSSSASGAIKVRTQTGSTLFSTPAVIPATGTTSADRERFDPPATATHGHVAYIALDSALNSKLIIDAQNAIEDLPELHQYSGLTWATNMHSSAANQAANRAGKFWSLGPDTHEIKSAEFLPGMFPTIMHEYHNDTRIPAVKQT